MRGSHYNNLIDRFSSVFDTSAEVCELFSTRFCSSKEVIQLQRKNVMAFKMS